MLYPASHPPWLKWPAPAAPTPTHWHAPRILALFSPHPALPSLPLPPARLPSSGAAHHRSHPPGRRGLPDLLPELQAGPHRHLCALAAGAKAGCHAVGQHPRADHRCAARGGSSAGGRQCRGRQRWPAAARGRPGGLVGCRGMRCGLRACWGPTQGLAGAGSVGVLLFTAAPGAAVLRFLPADVGPRLRGSILGL